MLKLKPQCPGVGRYLDAEGVHRAEDLCPPTVGKRPRPILVPTTSAQLLRLSAQGGPVAPNITGAQKFTSAVIRTYLP